MKTHYTVDILRSGQPRPYADTEREYLITVLAESTYGPDKGTMKPWLMYGDLETRIKTEEQMRAKGTMHGGESPDQLRTNQRDWAKKIIRGLCQNFREAKDEDGRTGMDAAFYPTLTKLTLDARAGTIRAFIIEAYTD